MIFASWTEFSKWKEEEEQTHTFYVTEKKYKPSGSEHGEVCINLIPLDLLIPTQSAHHNGYILFVVGMVIMENARRPVQQTSRDNIERIQGSSITHAFPVCMSTSRTVVR